MKNAIFCVFAVALLGAGNCDNGNGFTRQDASVVPAGITYQDIGTKCEYDPAQPLDDPTNTCPKVGLTCVIASSDGFYTGYGTFLYEAVPLFTRFLATTDEGICTLVSAPGRPSPPCPLGTYAVLLSSGHQICMRGCDTSEDCGRDGYVCDYRMMNGATYNPNTGAIDPLPVRMCVPACLTDVPYCLRTFIYQSFLYVHEGDLFGARECDVTSGLCRDVTAHGGRYVGDRCTHTSECGAGDICLSGWLYGAPEDHGFCAHYCDPSGQNQQLKCVIGQGCEFFLDVGYCFPDCSANLCAGEGQQCAKPDPNKAGLRPGQEWRLERCIQCELSSLICAGSDAGVSTDAASGDAGRDGGSSG